ncbi:hypothetical protein EMCRGX_G028735 [Ephydatia muelleri]
MAALGEELHQVIKRQRGVLFARPALVHRAMYAGRGVIANNVEFTADRVDSRGYLPVEWWIMSKTEARNAIPKKNEGITAMVINKREVPITELVAVAEEAIFGSHASSWPLTKILDIGGTERVPHYSTSRGGEALPEVPPIPCHVHCGEVVNGRCGCGQGKTEAYFFPPLDIPPYNLKLGPVKTRLGLQSHITREEVLKALEQFGCYDDLYSLLNVYEIHPWETWHIEEKLPQDDYNMLAWQLGQPLNQADLHTIKDVHQLKGLPNEGALLQGAINWEMNLAGDFRERWWHSCEVLCEGSWGRQTLRRQVEPVTDPSCIAWSGVGTVNGQDLNCTVELMKEFLVVPNHSLEICNTAESGDLIILTVFPLVAKDS